MVEPQPIGGSESHMKTLAWIVHLFVPSPMRRVDVSPAAQLQRIGQQLEAEGRLVIDLRDGSYTLSPPDILSVSQEDGSTE
jgi:hypothetical protein